MTPTQKVADFVVNTDFSSFPTEAVRIGKRLILDCLGVALAAKSDPVVVKLIKILKAQGGKKETRVWGQSFSLPLANAVQINATMGHALDFDDSAFSHPTSTILPVVVGLGEYLQLSGSDVLGGLLIAYEVFGSISLSSNQDLLRNKGWHPTPVLGTISVAATAAKLMRLDEAGVRMAMGIAGSCTSGLGQNFGTMTKPLHVGFSARNGLMAAQMAREGIIADGHILEAERGYGAVFFGKDGHDFGKIDQILGPPYKVITPGVNIKPWPCCRGAHRSIEVALSLQKKIAIREEEVESIECDLHLDGPTLHHYPGTGLEAKFSIAYCVSVALLKGRVVIEDFTDQSVSDPVVQRLMKKVIHLRRPGAEEVITLNLKGGRSFSGGVEFVKGDAKKNPFSDEDLTEKFKTCVKEVLPGRRASEAIQQISKLERAPNFREFMEQILGS